MSNGRTAWTIEQDQQLAALWADPSKSQEDIASEIGRDPRVVRKRAKRLGFGPRPAKQIKARMHTVFHGARP